MRVVDCHVHIHGQADAASIIGQMDANGVGRTILISAPERVSLQLTRANLLQAKALCEAAPDRLSALAWVNPTIPGVAGLAAEALTEMGFAGIKIIPDHWFAYEERLQHFWAAMDDLEASILFHTGILYGFDDGSRFCRPLYLEALVNYPRIHFAMAHISWPWCEECLAVMGRMRAATRGTGLPWQSYVDITPGTPPHIRKQALANAVAFCGADRILFGTDCKVPGSLVRQKQLLDRDLAIFDEIGLTDEQQQRILAGTADELFPPQD